jgi:hypothetical protein
MPRRTSLGNHLVPLRMAEKGGPMSYQQEPEGQELMSNLFVTSSRAKTSAGTRNGMIYRYSPDLSRRAIFSPCSGYRYAGCHCWQLWASSDWTSNST